VAEPAENASRRTAIVASAIGVFQRYGFKKTSMDDLARAAGLSRQGLYLHFTTKEALFKEAVQYVVGAMRDGFRAALATDGPIEERVFTAFDAVHGAGVSQFGDHMDELLETATSLLGPIAEELEKAIVGDLAKALKAGGVADGWKDAGVGAKDLATHLHDASSGLKHRVTTQEDYREGLRVAVRIVCRGAAR
jgi:AcrR family transcriptional regulator